MSAPHDALFHALIDDPRRADILIRDYLPADIVSRLADEPPILLDGSFVDPELNPTRSDRLFGLSLRDAGTLLLHALVEHKSSPFPWTPVQVQGYRVEIWRRLGTIGPDGKLRLPPIITIVFYHGRRPWTVPTSISGCVDADEDLRRLAGEASYLLCDLGPVPDAELSSDGEVRAGLRTLKHASRSGDPEALPAAVLADLRDGTFFEEQVIRYIIRAFPSVTVDLLTRVARRVRPDREGNLISLAAKEWLSQGRTEGLAEGLAKGREEGLLQGVAKGKADAILFYLESQFGTIPPDLEARVRRTAPEAMDALFRKAMGAASLDDVFSAGKRRRAYRGNVMRRSGIRPLPRGAFPAQREEQSAGDQAPEGGADPEEADA
ncbi:Rpn family recombination-promoting nuclease/putative transposase [Skermanella mucosa]|uniref:Rpn family recombination-promoting nuclease/putative transposase n=1 Tax=Skermanella mucosa TaxID=1789672 RepID=UPI00192CE020|nr:Rpn family recombination-promoting nuclease/putative transposase [Skermanella mucosa]UEM21517.1 Rpn family recombination-promoting nuclease/putative transposase [Skermanella mucosa]